MIQVFNVRQGDSFLIHPNFGCNFDEIPLLVDCGPKSGNVYSKFSNNEIDVLITHSHRDHIGGIVDITSKIRNLYIPYFLPEVWRIFEYLKRYLFDNVVDLDLINNQFKRIIVVGEGDMLCDHLQVFNPPKSGSDVFNKFELNRLSIDNALRRLNEYGIQIPNEESIINYQSLLTNIDNVTYLNDQNQPYNENARSYVHNFFISLADSLSVYDNDLNTLITHIRNKFQSLIHKTCIVFRYEYDGKGSILFSGDADEFAFERILNSGWNIASDYLKVPHHGSRGNMSLQLLKEINPKAAIFSHKNGLYGRSIDPHPHVEVLEYCKTLGVRMYFTNDVIKHHTTLYPKYIGTVDEFIEFM